MTKNSSRIKQLIKRFVSSLSPDELGIIVNSLDNEKLSGAVNKTLEEFFIENKNAEGEEDETV